MAAQKLTKSRFIQLMVALVILVSLFFYRTYAHKQQTEKQTEQQTLQQQNTLSQ